MPRTARSARSTIQPLVTIASAAVLLGALTACGGGDATATDAVSADTQAAADGTTGGATGRGEGLTLPGTRGTIAAIDGTTLQVQNDQSGQVAVSYTAATTITAQVTGSLSDIVVGSCVRVTGVGETADDTTPLTAATVTVTEKVDGTCSAWAGAGGGGAGRSDGAPDGGSPSTDFPERAPERAPGGALDGARGFGSGASGEVSAVDASTITLEVSVPGDDATTSTSVLLDDTTTVTVTQDSDAASLVVGECVVATGDADSTGAVTAEAIQLSDPVDGACQAGGPGGFGGAGGRGAPGDATGDDS